MTKVAILTATQIELKLKRMAYEIWEHNSEEKEIIIVGIEDGGAVVARNIAGILKKVSNLKVKFFGLSINKKAPLTEAISIDAGQLNDKVVVLIDDVANSGKTLLYAIKPLLDYTPRTIQIAVLVDRKHKNFPVNPDYIGHSVSTTLQDHIIVTFEGEMITGAHLE
ncbi:phosphoribosyltransferase family protein [Taibaiella chishuiensis]|uniref:Pyrimidine operon attenuation protein/uracil phosphoribosyltransferase n=1 Tax=Taibaiella chishuiensis TaxID=1434707 RepID=A0A2P8CSU8_9BACT|nr:phosphoribosyltransferase family protein [Taibaiella chishuiensis]PSK88022.1 pyrimidine operon attenuation protein/uracil phosphoribosyltransferase [Taibaiella chishuiensis]